MQTAITQLRASNDIKVEHELSKKQQRINSLTQEIENKDIENRNRYEALLESKKENEIDTLRCIARGWLRHRETHASLGIGDAIESCTTESISCR